MLISLMPHVVRELVNLCDRLQRRDRQEHYASTNTILKETEGMAVPDFQSLMLPALQALTDRAETPLADVRSRIAVTENLTAEDLREILPSGRQSVFTNRVSWTIIHIARAGLVERVRRGVYRLTDDGEKLLRQKPVRIDMSVLREYAAYREWRSASTPPEERSGSWTPPDESTTDTPEEALDRAAQQVRGELEYDVLDRVCKAAPEFLEQVIIDLLIAMGYGGGDAAMGQVTGRSGDGGIDGTVKEDTLGLDEVYVQAKKYSDGNTVGESELRNFAGAIDAAGTNKGVFVTTSSFTPAARRYVARSPKRIVLLDGKDLARYMVAHGIGVRTRVCYEIKRIDEDYFNQ